MYYCNVGKQKAFAKKLNSLGFFLTKRYFELKSLRLEKVYAFWKEKTI